MNDTPERIAFVAGGMAFHDMRERDYLLGKLAQMHVYTVDGRMEVFCEWTSAAWDLEGSRGMYTAASTRHPDVRFNAANFVELLLMVAAFESNR